MSHRTHVPISAAGMRDAAMADLPPPSPDALAHSARVARHVRAEIAAGEGWMSFRRYMELVLYAPGLGYYAAGAAKLGPGGDFVTAPEMTPLFGAALATQVAAILATTERRDIVELGAGTGRLAASLLRALAADGTLPASYAILETSPDLRARQRHTLDAEAPDLARLVRWLDGLPEVIEGAVLANEVLDAVPVSIVHRGPADWLERGVVIAGDATPPRFGLAFADRAAPEPLARAARERCPEQTGYTTELNLAAEALVADVGRRLRRGAAILVDYGFPAREYYHPQRAMGTLMCHYQHRSHEDPFFYPGLSDITAHVDFSAIAAAGERTGLELAGFCAQAPFLLGCGILDRLARTGAPDSVAYMKAAGAVQRLLSPAEMGELFKVVALETRRSDIAWPGFALARGHHRL